ncbi:MAG: hypothetical protein SAK29_31160 [Scytonema sp. PMC 1069.18]|nr:hypothetical protein [Scytonema sp. PMC 1069.18]MEC4879804.1 hypothetical protein [Scytonema sp. PMC 1070.18]
MIKDYQQYLTTKYWAQRFAEAEMNVKENEERRLKEPERWQLMQDSYAAQRQNLLDEITEYEALIAHDPREKLVLEIDDINYLSHLVIKARIALKLTQKELAILSDRTEEQIQAFEDKNYHNASFLDFLAISNALGIKIINGKFVAQLSDFYKQELRDIRSSVNLDDDMKAAS